MPTRKQGDIAPKPTDSTFWDQAIADAEDRIKKLKFTLRVYRQKRDRGEPWPGLKKQEAGR